MRQVTIASIIIAGAYSMTAYAADWKPADNPLMTRWAADVTPDNVWPEYPRPQLRRAQWLNLNGLWNYAITETRETPPEKWDGEILVPFAVESALSGVKRPLLPTQQLWYQRSLEVPGDWDEEQRIMLNFGAVDWHARVWVNDTRVGEHKGGYDPFSFDVTDALDRASANTLTVCVTDPTNAGSQARGKQVLNPHAIFYTAVSGIWQTVWLEPVPLAYFKQVNFTTEINPPRLIVSYELGGPTTERRRGRLDWVEAAVIDPADGETIATGSGTGRIVIDVPDAEQWSPSNPKLYDVKLTLNVHRYQNIDPVTSYVGFREITARPDADGQQQLFLNDESLFSYGPLDQGYWPDGLYTAPTDAALKYDIDVTKQLGFNSIRKHVKVEPARWYYWADKLGVLVWQDMPSAWHEGEYEGKTTPRTEADQAQFELELYRTFDALRAFPSIVIWVPFNEGWGQFDTERLTWNVSRLDPTRLVDNPSGWHDKQVGHVVDWHTYPDPIAPHADRFRAGVIGEFGGLNLAIEDHLWQTEGNFGYRGYDDRASLTDAYLNMVRALNAWRALRQLSGAIYTQTTDVEIEVNGLMTYDRAVIKIDPEAVAAETAALYRAVPEARVVLPVASDKPMPWKYTTAAPADNWAAPDFDDSAWSTGESGFGTEGTPGLVDNTLWNTPDIRLRKRITARIGLERPLFQVLHDEGGEIYVNGKQVATFTGHTGLHKLYPVPADAFRRGVNTIAVHVRQTEGGQAVDVGLIDLR